MEFGLFHPKVPLGGGVVREGFGNQFPMEGFEWICGLQLWGVFDFWQHVGLQLNSEMIPLGVNFDVFHVRVWYYHRLSSGL